MTIPTIIPLWFLFLVRAALSHSDTSCNNSAIDSFDSETSGRALLQKSQVRSILLASETEGEGANGRQPETVCGTTATLDEAGWAAVYGLCCTHEVEIYIRRLVATMDKVICNEYGLLGLLPYYSCEADPVLLQARGKEYPTFAKLYENLLASTPPAQCAFITAADELQFCMLGECTGEPDVQSHRRRQCLPNTATPASPIVTGPATPAPPIATLGPATPAPPVATVGPATSAPPIATVGPATLAPTAGPATSAPTAVPVVAVTTGPPTITPTSATGTGAVATTKASSTTIVAGTTATTTVAGTSASGTGSLTTLTFTLGPGTIVEVATTTTAHVAENLGAPSTTLAQGTIVDLVTTTAKATTTTSTTCQDDALSAEACAKAALFKGLHLGKPGISNYPFIKDWASKGCYTYTMTDENTISYYAGAAYYGTVNGAELTSTDQLSLSAADHIHLDTCEEVFCDYSQAACVAYAQAEGLEMGKSGYGQYSLPFASDDHNIKGCYREGSRVYYGTINGADVTSGDQLTHLTSTTQSRPNTCWQGTTTTTTAGVTTTTTTPCMDLSGHYGDANGGHDSLLQSGCSGQGDGFTYTVDGDTVTGDNGWTGTVTGEPGSYVITWGTGGGPTYTQHNCVDISGSYGGADGSHATITQTGDECSGTFKPSNGDSFTYTIDGDTVTGSNGWTGTVTGTSGSYVITWTGGGGPTYTQHECVDISGSFGDANGGHDTLSQHGCSGHGNGFTYTITGDTVTTSNGWTGTVTGTSGSYVITWGSGGGPTYTQHECVDISGFYGDANDGHDTFTQTGCTGQGHGFTYTIDGDNITTSHGWTGTVTGTSGSYVITWGSGGGPMYTQKECIDLSGCMEFTLAGGSGTATANNIVAQGACSGSSTYVTTGNTQLTFTVAGDVVTASSGATGTITGTQGSYVITWISGAIWTQKECPDISGFFTTVDHIPAVLNNGASSSGFTYTIDGTTITTNTGQTGTLSGHEGSWVITWTDGVIHTQASTYVEISTGTSCEEHGAYTIESVQKCDAANDHLGLSSQDVFVPSSTNTEWPTGCSHAGVGSQVALNFEGSPAECGTKHSAGWTFTCICALAKPEAECPSKCFQCPASTVYNSQCHAYCSSSTTCVSDPPAGASTDCRGFCQDPNRYELVGTGWCRPDSCDVSASNCRVNGFAKEPVETRELCESACAAHTSCIGYAYASSAHSSNPHKCVVYTSGGDVPSGWTANPASFIDIGQTSGSPNVECYKDVKYCTTHFAGTFVKDANNQYSGLTSVKVQSGGVDLFVFYAQTGAMVNMAALNAYGEIVELRYFVWDNQCTQLDDQCIIENYDSASDSSGNFKVNDLSCQETVDPDKDPIVATIPPFTQATTATTTIQAGDCSACYNGKGDGTCISNPQYDNKCTNPSGSDYCRDGGETGDFPVYSCGTVDPDKDPIVATIPPVPTQSPCVDVSGTFGPIGGDTYNLVQTDCTGTGLIGQPFTVSGNTITWGTATGTISGSSGSYLITWDSGLQWFQQDSCSQNLYASFVDNEGIVYKQRIAVTAQDGDAAHNVFYIVSGSYVKMVGVDANYQFVDARYILLSDCPASAGTDLAVSDQCVKDKWATGTTGFPYSVQDCCVCSSTR